MEKRVKMPEEFQSKYCDECSLKLCCDRYYNPHCAKVIAEHTLAVMEITNMLSEKETV